MHWWPFRSEQRTLCFSAAPAFGARPSQAVAWLGVPCEACPLGHPVSRPPGHSSASPSPLC
eukprot:486543-Alexandrium_andersonii.AAC.1